MLSKSRFRTRPRGCIHFHIVTTTRITRTRRTRTRRRRTTTTTSTTTTTTTMSGLLGGDTTLGVARDKKCAKHTLE